MRNSSATCVDSAGISLKTRLGKSESDRSGVQRIALNVMWSWMGQGVAIISGFIVPRLIDRRLGQEALGVWDFSWSVVSYFKLVQLGLVASVNRYIAMYRAKGDVSAVNGVAGSATWILRGMGAVIMLLTVGACAFVGASHDLEIASHISTIQWLLLLLGSSLALQVSSAAYGGVLTGHHRWDIHNGIYAGTNLLLLFCMPAALLLGYGLVGLALVTFASEALGRLFSAQMAYRVCPKLDLSWKHFHWATARQLFLFGGKGVIQQLGFFMLNNTISVMIAVALGPAMLAIYSRSNGLIRNVNMFVQKYGTVLTPVASALHAQDKREEISHLMISSTRCAILGCLPIFLWLMVFGSDVIEIWMGSNYSQSPLVTIMAAGQLTYIAHIPIVQTLSGLNAHGRPAVVYLVGALIGVCAATIWLNVGGGITGVAVCAVLPLTFMGAVFLPLYACRRLELEVWHFLKSVWSLPLACAIPFSVWLLCTKWLCPAGIWVRFASGTIGGSILILALYWKFVLSDKVKQHLARFVPSKMK